MVMRAHAFEHSHSSEILGRPGVPISTRVAPSGSSIGFPSGVKSSHCSFAAPSFSAFVAPAGGALTRLAGQQIFVARSGSAEAGNEFMATNDCGGEFGGVLPLTLSAFNATPYS